MNYYNEWDPKAADWIRELIKTGLLPEGEVDERSITEIKPDELDAYTQCHFFAGIGGWSQALKLAGVPSTQPLWTGSAPCQPFSSAGRHGGYDDERHLAPAWLDLIRKCRPPVILGEQVARAATNSKHPWMDDLQDELEAEGYAVGKAVLPACCVGAPHIRQRLWFGAVRVADTSQQGLQGRQHDPAEQAGQERSVSGAGGSAGWMADSCDAERDRRGEAGAGCSGIQHAADHCKASQRPSPTQTGWHNPDWLFCRDGKWRPARSGASVLAYGVPSRVGRLRGYGNAIVPQVAAEFVRAFLEASDEWEACYGRRNR